MVEYYCMSTNTIDKSKINAFFDDVQTKLLNHGDTYGDKEGLLYVRETVLVAIDKIKNSLFILEDN